MTGTPPSVGPRSILVEILGLAVRAKLKVTLDHAMASKFELKAEDVIEVKTLDF